jgi:hypothetical protein
VDKLISPILQGNSILADSGTEQLEFIALSQRTGDQKYQQKVFYTAMTSVLYRQSIRIVLSFFILFLLVAVKVLIPIMKDMMIDIVVRYCIHGLVLLSVTHIRNWYRWSWSASQFG